MINLFYLFILPFAFCTATDVFDGNELGYFHSYQPARVSVNPLGVRLIKFSVVQNPGPVTGTVSREIEMVR
jgi:hypothetical protein